MSNLTIGPVLATGSTTARRLSDWLGDSINVWAFASAKPSGVLCDGTDDKPAFDAAIASLAIGAEFELLVPRGTYTLSGNITNSGRVVTARCQPGVVLNGGVLYLNRVIAIDGGVEHTNTQLSTQPGSYIHGRADYVSNLNNIAGYAFYQKYTSFVTTASNPNGGDIGFARFSDFRNLNVTAGFGMWDYTLTPASGGSGQPWGVVGAEFNIVNRGPDTGWAGTRGGVNWSGVLQIVPDNGAGFDPPYGLGVNALFGLAFASETFNHSTGKKLGFYNGILLEDAIAAGGRFMHLNGSASVSSGDWPQAIMTVNAKWVDGIDLSSGTFSGNQFKGTGFRVDANGALTATPAASATPAANGEMTFELTNNTTLKIKVKGSDGTVRSTTLTLS